MALTEYQAMWIAYYCTSETAGVERPLKPTEGLNYYRIYTDQQCFVLRHKIIGGSPNSVEKYGHAIDPKHLLMLSPGWTMAQLATVIQTNSVAAGQKSVAHLDSNIKMAHDLFEQALSLATTEAKKSNTAMPKAAKAFLQMNKADMKKGGAKQ